MKKALPTWQAPRPQGDRDNYRLISMTALDQYFRGSDVRYLILLYFLLFAVVPLFPFCSQPGIKCCFGELSRVCFYTLGYQSFYYESKHYPILPQADILLINCYHHHHHHHQGSSLVSLTCFLCA